jgi:hypothetical protein
MICIVIVLRVQQFQAINKHFANVKWIDQALEEAMVAIEKATCSLKVARMSWNIPMTSFSNHLSGKSNHENMGH